MCARLRSCADVCNLPMFVTICLLALAAAPARTQPASPDRMVAEWAVRMGGSVVLEGQHKAISDLADLPASDFHVQTLNFTGITQWASALEDPLEECERLLRFFTLLTNAVTWAGGK